MDLSEKDLFKTDNENKKDTFAEESELENSELKPKGKRLRIKDTRKIDYNQSATSSRPYQPMYGQTRQSSPSYYSQNRPSNNEGSDNQRYFSSETPQTEGGSEYNETGGYQKRYYQQGNQQQGGYQRRNYGDQQGGYQQNKPYGNNQGGGYYQRSNYEKPQGGYQQRGGGYQQGGGYNRGDYQQNRQQQGNYQQGGGYQQRSYQQGGGNYQQRNYQQGGGYNQQGGGYQQRGYQQRNSGYQQGGGYNNYQQGGQKRQFGNNKRFQQNNQMQKKKMLKMPKPMPQPVKYQEIVTDMSAPIRLNKYLANAGVCSRREADEFIQAGAVKVNNEVITELGTKITRLDKVTYNDQPVSIESKIYIVLNKPKNCVTTADDPQNRQTVMDIVKNACHERIYPVGRLDRNTTGVLLLTNDGEMAAKLTHPSFKKKKIYHVWLDHEVKIEDMEKLANGIELDDGEIHADAISYANEDDKSQVGIEIHSGKNRIVRRMFELLGYHVIKLDRVYFAGLTKKNLGRGKWRYLTEQEVNTLRMGSYE